MNLPVYKERLRGAVAEAQARLAQRSAEFVTRTDQVNLQVQEDCEQVLESEKGVRLFNETILPAAIENVKAAYGLRNRPHPIPFAHRSATQLGGPARQELAEYHRRRATLERVIGGASPLPQTEALPEPRKLPK